MKKHKTKIIILASILSAILLFPFVAAAHFISKKVEHVLTQENSFISGKLDINYLERFNKAASHGGSITVSSTGGNAEIALEIAEIIKKNKLRIIFSGACLSACAEIIFPAAFKYSKVSFVGYPVIGFHQNSEIFRMSLSDKSHDAFEKCIMPLNRNFLRFSDEVGRNRASFQLQLEAMSAVPKSATVSDDCSYSYIKLNRKYWFPSSLQLKSLFSMNLPGPVCADSFACTQKVISMIGKDGDRFMMGTAEIYFSPSK